MNALGVRLLKTRPTAVVPRYATEDSAGCDLCAALDAPLTVPAGGTASVPTGIAISMERRDVVAVVCARSGLAFRHRISLVNGVGIIDADYRGEIAVGLRNDSAEDYVVSPGDRIAQILFLPVFRAEFSLADSLDETARGTGGFGSSGKR